MPSTSPFRRRPVARLLPLLCGALLLGVLGAGTSGAQGQTWDEGRGRRLFDERNCSRCHGPDGKGGIGPTLAAIRRPQGVVEFAGRIWSHAPIMVGLMEKMGFTWSTLDPQETADLMVFLRATPRLDPTPNLFQGQIMLLRKGCLKCHQFRGEGGRVGPDLIRYQGGYGSPVTWVSAMWNHAPKMLPKFKEMGLLYPRFDGNEMGDLYGFLRASAEATSEAGKGR